MCVCVCVFTNPSVRAGQFFIRSLTFLKSDFFFSLTDCHSNAKEISLPYYLPITGERIVGFMPFTKVLARCKMQTRPEFELGIPSPFPKTLAITLQVPP